jgi:hypothetical protein
LAPHKARAPACRLAEQASGSDSSNATKADRATAGNVPQAFGQMHFFA